MPAYLEMADGPPQVALITDVRGSVRLAVDVSDGAVLQHIVYSPFGRELVREGGAPWLQPLGYAGGLTDASTGLVRFGARDYDAYSGRWTALDPIGFAAGDTNLYGYVLQDPVNRVDPTGLESIWDIAGDLVWEAAPYAVAWSFSPALAGWALLSGCEPRDDGAKPGRSSFDESFSITPATNREMLGQAIARLKELRETGADGSQLADEFERLAEQIAVHSGHSWEADREFGADGSAIFTGEYGHALVVSPDGGIYRGNITNPTHFKPATGGLNPVYNNLKEL